LSKLSIVWAGARTSAVAALAGEGAERVSAAALVDRYAKIERTFEFPATAAWDAVEFVLSHHHSLLDPGRPAGLSAAGLSTLPRTSH
jgi:hypothetical protein